MLKARDGDLFNIFRNFDLGSNRSVFLFNSDKLIDAAENRLTSRGDQALANAEKIDLRALIDAIPNDVLILGIRDHNLTIGIARLV